MKKLFCATLVMMTLGATATLRADDALRRVQQSLREQGFYYGPVNGAPGDETTQAVRRYQIRNGLPVTGQLDDATKRSIQQTASAAIPSGTSGSGDEPRQSGASAGNSGGTSQREPTRAVPTPSNPEPTRREPPANDNDNDDGAATGPAYQRPTVRPVPDTANRSQLHDVEDEDAAASSAPNARSDSDARPGLNARPDLRAAPGAPEDRPLPRNAVLPSARLSDLFASTPYEFAPPPVQADVLRRAQRALTREGFYDGAVSGAPSDLTSDSLAHFQGVNRLRKTGRLDVNTLGLLRLLPGRQSVGPRDRAEGGPNIIFEGRRGY